MTAEVLENHLVCLDPQKSSHNLDGEDFTVAQGGFRPTLTQPFPFQPVIHKAKHSDKKSGEIFHGRPPAVFSVFLFSGRLYKEVSVFANPKKLAHGVSLLRGGRPGDTYFTTNKYRTVRGAEERLALPHAPEVRLDFEIANQPRVYGPRKVAPAFGKPGGGIEYWSPDPVRVRIIRWRDLR